MAVVRTRDEERQLGFNADGRDVVTVREDGDGDGEGGSGEGSLSSLLDDIDTPSYGSARYVISDCRRPPPVRGLS